MIWDFHIINCNRPITKSIEKSPD
ncbi:hypothetical protein SPV_2532 [Streptococcus pneumoniae]|nr:hypothetical protein SPV_2532 [Streptococcus pneumoniae]